jgi:hypothetical protein
MDWLHPIVEWARTSPWFPFLAAMVALVVFYLASEWAHNRNADAWAEHQGRLRNRPASHYPPAPPRPTRPPPTAILPGDVREVGGMPIRNLGERVIYVEASPSKDGCGGDCASCAGKREA